MNISLLISSLPTQNTTTRMRVWRALKASGAVTLRDGVYILPAEHSKKFDAIADDLISENGNAYIFQTVAVENLDIAKIFNRKEEYDILYQQISQLRQELNQSNKKELLKQIRKLRKQLDALIDIDYFPTEAKQQTLRELNTVEQAILRFGEIDEPNNLQGHLQTFHIDNFQNQIWATRKRPWIDRLASAWLIQNFIDPNANFLWLETPSDCPKSALGFDFDGAKFSHIEHLVTFEVLLHSFSLHEQKALNKIAAIVHFLDVGGVEPPEASGIEKVIQGLRNKITDDDQLLELSNYIFDGLYANFLRE
ncbi:chromate resistance protein [Acinetobacter haemolyticus]|uniref:chromate resistance protein ChrB domain-containing protein n=1 Tax=Acinetobacter TaxID=469 RepID=UPI001331C5BE|nr:chromate resistance protein ChrB domain-containing protein [Acinetobacter haemolyticus]NAR16899.1 chromate resistance protein [Acinetobacter haemolyticus]NAR35055.1 chromate resistance protein [Acinetobacter haemolyticus]NAR46162.1 chromate resistance protein [Acinetobacter haemolyticus]NCU23164.1 chromate resistance protein [Acinetobacter haemolyticus]QHI19213.1 chromate resistance protein [Acinetobacter haemolyticus]